MLIIELCKYPTPGQVKTRLIPTIGAEAAADLQRKMSRYVFSEINKAAAITGASIEICYDCATEADFKNLFGDKPEFVKQSNGDLGDRINNAFLRAFALGYKKVLLTGSDCPCVSSDILIHAFNSLSTSEAVVGPTLDGGYYLLGLTKSMPFLFENMPWSTEVVFEMTIERLKKRKISYSILKAGWDVDRPEDIYRFETLMKKGI